MRFFNTAGPVNCQDHYCLPPLQRFNLTEILGLIEQKKYFVLHAPRQTGKTSCLLALMDYLNREGRYISLYANLEAAQGARENVDEAMRSILSTLGSQALINLDDRYLRKSATEILDESGPFGALGEALSRWSARTPKPIVAPLG